MEISFKVGTKNINKVLLEFKKLQKNFFETGKAKIRVMPGAIEICGQGIYKTVHCETDGLGEVFVSLKLLYSFSSSCKISSISFKFRDSELECGSSVCSLPGLKVETLHNSPDLDLTINADDFSVLREAFLKGDELMQNYNLDERVKLANTNLIKSVNDAYSSLKAFRITKKEIMDLIVLRVQKKNEKPKNVVKVKK
jgi:hypothetical protein